MSLVRLLIVQAAADEILGTDAVPAELSAEEHEAQLRHFLTPAQRKRREQQASRKAAQQQQRDNDGGDGGDSGDSGDAASSTQQDSPAVAAFKRKANAARVAFANCDTNRDAQLTLKEVSVLAAPGDDAKLATAFGTCVCVCCVPHRRSVGRPADRSVGQPLVSEQFVACLVDCR